MDGMFEIDKELEATIRELCEEDMLKAIQVKEKLAREEAIILKDAVLAGYEEEEDEEAKTGQYDSR